MGIYTKTPNGWEAIAQDAKAVSSFGSIVPDGNQTGEGTYTDADGREWVWYEWTDPDKASSLTTDGGLLWVLCVGGAAHPHSNETYKNQGQPGLVNEGLWEFGPGTHTVTVGDRGQTFGSSKNSSGKPSSVGEYGTQGEVLWGSAGLGRGGIEAGSQDEKQAGYKSRITGDELEYAPGYAGPDQPGRGESGGTYNAGCVIIATVVNGAKPKPVQPALTPATVVSAPVKVSGSADPIEWFVKQTDGTRKKIYMLPGNTAGGDENVFEVALGAGVLPGVMVAAGSCGPDNSYSGSGAGGLIGQGAHQPVILPVQGTATYTIKVASTSLFVSALTQAQPTTIAVQGQTPFATAVGGGQGYNAQGGQERRTGSGGSGGGGAGNEGHDIGIYGLAANGHGVIGQGNDGNIGTYAGGGGYGSGGEQTTNGGAGFNLKDSLGLDGTDAATAAFLDSVTVDGFIAGGGAGQGGTATAGGAAPGGNGKDYTGGGGSGIGGTGGCGMVLLIEDV